MHWLSQLKPNMLKFLCMCDVISMGAVESFEEGVFEVNVAIDLVG
jgi:hypothetical protein